MDVTGGQPCSYPAARPSAAGPLWRFSWIASFEARKQRLGEKLERQCHSRITPPVREAILLQPQALGGWLALVSSSGHGKGGEPKGAADGTKGHSPSVRRPGRATIYHCVMPGCLREVMGIGYLSAALFAIKKSRPQITCGRDMRRDV